MNLSKAAVGLFSSVFLLGSSYFVGAHNAHVGVGAFDRIDVPIAKVEERHMMIIGGSDADRDEYPWYTYVQVPSETEGYVSTCGGQLISPTVVLTAAHCITYSDGSVAPADHPWSRVWVGAYENTGSGFSVASTGLASILPHPSWNPSTINYDFALLVLDQAVTTTTPVKLDLDGISESFSGTEEIWAIGFGDTVSDPSVFLRPTVLQEVTMTHITQSECNIFSIPITDAMLCAGEGELDGTGDFGTCQGDSGGPSFIKQNGEDVLVGVTSFGPIVCADFVNIFARVSAVADWIRTNVGDLPSSPTSPTAPTPTAPTPTAPTPTPPTPGTCCGGELDNVKNDISTMKDQIQTLTDDIADIWEALQPPPPPCADKEGVWERARDGRSNNWCKWATKGDTTAKCNNKKHADIKENCPKACGTCT